MKAISLTQPWASLVSIGAKQIETRSWKTSYRGTLAIHAALNFPKECKDLIFTEPFNSALQRIETNSNGLKELPRGVIVATVELLSCVRTDQLTMTPRGTIGTVAWNLTEMEMAFGDYHPLRYGWILGNLHRLKQPIPCKGALGLWNVPANVESLVREQINEQTS